jgi:hypothetical protein
MPRAQPTQSRGGTAAAPPAAADHAWEKEFTPKVGRGRVLAAAALYALWMVFLAVIAVERWTGTLQ